MASKFNKAERYVKQDGEYKLLSYATSSESVEMTDGTDLQTKADSIDKAISDETTRAKNAESDLDSKKINKTTVATSSTLGLVKSGTDITVDSSGNVSVNDNSHNHTVSNISDLTATASELNVLDGITATTTELNYIDGVTSNIQTQLDGKSSNGHTHDDRYYTETEMDTKLNAKLNTSLKGSVNGLAELDENGKVPSSQLPSYVDDVIEGYYYNSNFYTDSAHTIEVTGETGKIYIDLSTNKTYRWSGSAFVVISETLALGETSSTAYRGDRGKIAYDHSQTAHAPSNAQANQNAFSNVLVGSINIAANTPTDTLTLVAGSNITITPDATNDKITISSTGTGSGTDTKVTQTLTISDASYPLLLAPTGQTATTTTTSYFATKFQANPSTGEFTAPILTGTTGVYATKYYGTTDARQAFIFNGYCGGKRDTADILKVSGSSADGTTNTLNIDTDLDDISFTKPMYVNTFTATTVESFGDVIANYGTSNQVSLIGLKDDLMGGGSAYYNGWEDGTTTLKASTNTIIYAFNILKSGIYMFIPNFRTAVPSGHIFSVGIFNYTGLQYPVTQFQDICTMIGTGKKHCMNGVQIFNATAGKRYYIMGYSTAAITLDTSNWYHVYCLKTT